MDARNRLDLEAALLTTWRINQRLTSLLIENLAEELWRMKVPGAPRRTVRMICGHLHNCRSMWVKQIGTRLGLTVPEPVDRHRVTREELLAALQVSGRAIGELLEAGLERGGRLPTVWGSPPDVMQFLAYHVAHEGHHRGQIVLLARQLGHPLPQQVTVGLWQWPKRLKEVESAKDEPRSRAKARPTTPREIPDARRQGPLK